MPERERFVFTVTTGRSGTVFLTELFQANLDATYAQVHHERTGVHDLAYHTPDTRHLRQFNTQGNTTDVVNFWRRKFAVIRQGPEPVYAEMSHFLAKAGLIENLALLNPEAQIELVILRRDIEETAWSLANRMDFANLGFTWQFYLDPRYNRNIVPSRPFADHGMLGHCLWYVLEMRTRAQYYRGSTPPCPNLRYHEVDLKQLREPEFVARFFAGLGLREASPQRQVVLPAPANQRRSDTLPSSERERLRQLIASYEFNPKQLVMDYVKAGKQLA